MIHLVQKQIISPGERLTMHKTTFCMENSMVGSSFFICSIHPGDTGLKNVLNKSNCSGKCTAMQWKDGYEFPRDYRHSPH